MASFNLAEAFALKYYRVKTEDINVHWIGKDFSTCMINDDVWNVGDMACALFHRVRREHVFAYVNCLDENRPSFRKFLSGLK